VSRYSRKARRAPGTEGCRCATCKQSSEASFVKRCVGELVAKVPSTGPVTRARTVSHAGGALISQLSHGSVPPWASGGCAARELPRAEGSGLAASPAAACPFGGWLWWMPCVSWPRLHHCTTATQCRASRQVFGQAEGNRPPRRRGAWCGGFGSCFAQDQQLVV